VSQAPFGTAQRGARVLGSGGRLTGNPDRVMQTSLSVLAAGAPVSAIASLAGLHDIGWQQIGALQQPGDLAAVDVLDLEMLALRVGHEGGDRFMVS